MQADDVLTAVLARPSYGGRARSLRGRRSAFSLELVEGFVARAGDILRSDPAKSRQLARLGLYVARRIGDAPATVRCLRTLCQAGLLSGHYPEALRAVDEALSLLDVHERGQVAELQSLRVQILTQLERFEEAREAGEQVLHNVEQLGSWQGVVRARMALADLAIQVSEPREALHHYAEVQLLLPPTVKPRFRGALAANRANALQACNRFRAAGRWFDHARRIFEAEGCDHTVAQMDYNLAYAQLLSGNYREALVRFASIESDFARLEDDMHLAHIDLDRAEAHLLMNLPAEARAHALRAARRFETLGLEKDLAQAEFFAGRAAAMLGELDEALVLYAAAQERFESVGLEPYVVNCLVQQAYASHRLGRSGAAQLLAEDADALLGPKANPLSAASVDLLRANLHLASGRAGRAHASAASALLRCRRIYAPWLHVEALRVLGTARRMQGRDEEAIRDFEEAVGLLERHRGGVPPDEYMSAFLSARSDLYAQLVDLLVQHGRVKRAFEVCERAKSRSLLDLLVRGHEAGEKIEETARIRFLRESLSAVYWHLFRAGGGADPAAAHDMAAKHAKAGELEAELCRLLRARSLANGADSAPDLMELPPLEEIQAGLDADTALIDYILTDSAVIVFLVTKGGISAHRRAVEPGEIDRGLLRYRFHLAKHERPELIAEELVLRATRENLIRLRHVLLDPLDGELDASRLVIAPHGALHNLPFHALPWGDGWVADAFEVVTVPSATVYLQCLRAERGAEGEPAVFGVPDDLAPEIAAECTNLASILGTGRLHLGSDATYAALCKAAGSARVLHVATHGMFRPEHPTMSGIRLADRWVTLHDLYALRLRAGLVVLSTCESGTAGVTSGGEVLGLSRGVLGAGAPALLCSQWRVRDGVTAAFMEFFYNALVEGRGAAAAHNHAMAEIRRLHPHPYYWAPFFLMGCPSRASSIEGNA